jgi:hypothetical protein
MSARSALRTLAGAAALALLAAAPAAQAQVIKHTVRSDNGPQLRAEALHERAAQLFEFPLRYRDAARLLREAALLRSPDDPVAVDELLLAGRLWHYARDWGSARRAFDEAAARSLGNGEITMAAHAYVDAAFNATAHAAWDEARQFVGKVERLAASPHLQVSERDGIYDRLQPTRIALAQRNR